MKDNYTLHENKSEQENEISDIDYDHMNEVEYNPSPPGYYNPIKCYEYIPDESKMIKWWENETINFP